MPRSEPGNRDASASEGGLYGRNKGKRPAQAPGARATLLPTTGPASTLPAVAGPLGYSFRGDENSGDALDAIQVIQKHKALALRGYAHKYGNGSALLPTSAVGWMDAYFWPQLVKMLYEKAQRRDGYRPTNSPADYDATNILSILEWVTSTAMTAQINIRVLDALYSGVLTNQGMRSMLPAFQNARERIDRLIETTNQLRYPAGYKGMVEYWSTVYTPRLGGPVIFNLFDFQPLMVTDRWTPATGTFTAWTSADLPDLTTSADVDHLMDDVELACTMLLNDNVVSGATGALPDLRMLMSLYDMLGMAAVPVGPRGIVVDEAKFTEQFKIDAFHFFDDKGALGTDTFLFWPDIGGSERSMLDVNFYGLSIGPEDPFWVGAKGVYAWDDDESATAGFAANSENMTAYGMVHDQDPGPTHGILHVRKFFTREDGWITPAVSLDFTDAGGCQAWIWAHPDLTIHPESWRVIMSEETEEAYHTVFGTPGSVRVPFDVFGQAFRVWLHTVWALPYIT